MIDDKFNSELITQCLCRLMEHCDAVQIFATVHAAGVTTQYIEGQGNYFARKGLVQDWIDIENNKRLCSNNVQEEDQED